ncbi:MAG: Mut7-C RNAse domain-containing protein [Anaerolineae bacterium]|nr:Mut7-C RNAse domain-containing protein [Anaerolineae bacterium]
MRSDPPALLVDAMLGRLCKWLRLMGYDAVYANHWPDAQIAAQARAEGRWVLTRDQALTRRRGIDCLFIDSQTLEAQIRQVIESLGMPPVQTMPRCPQCNASLVSVTRAQAQPHVPQYVWETQSEFGRCPNCDRYYWPGTHWQNIQSTLERVRKT